MQTQQFLKFFPNHLIVTPEENSTKGWKDLSRDLPDPQITGHAVYFTPNGFDSLRREQEDVTQFNSVYIDVDAPKESTPEEIETFVKQKTGEIYTTIEPSFIVRTKNGAHFHFLLEESVEVTEETTRDYKYLMDHIVKHFDADTGAKGINRVLRVPGFNHYKVIDDPYEVHLIHEDPDIRYTLEEIASYIDIPYPAPIKEETAVVTGTLTGKIETRLKMMLKKEKVDRLYNGDISDYPGPSEADSALCFHLAFWLEKDPEAMEQVWLQSPLGAREKTQKRKDYRTRTIENAIAGTANIYTNHEARGSVTQGREAADDSGTTDPCPERTAYHAHMAIEDRDDDWGKKLKWIEANYIQNFHKYFAIEYPHLKFEIGEDKSYWNYDQAEGVYVPVNFSSVRGIIIKMIIAEGLGAKATEYNSKMILNKYRAVSLPHGVTLDSFTNEEGWMHLDNGWLNRETLELTPHTPERLSMYKMQVKYDPEATCPKYDQFLDVDAQMPEDQVRVIDQFSGVSLTSSIEAQQMLILEGRPGCGKSMLPEIWMEVLGRKSTTMKLSSLDGSNLRFIGDSLAHKNFCFFDEANPKTKNINEFFMGLVTDKTIRIERKGINNVEFVKNTLKIVMSLNELPDHMPEGMKRRYKHIVFTRSFTDDGTVDPFYQKAILEDELPGVFNRMLKGLKDYEKMGTLTMIAGEEDRKREYTLAADDFSAFVSEHFEPVQDGEGRYEAKQMRNAFVSEFPKPYNKSLSVQGFNKKMKSIRLDEFKHITTRKSSGKIVYVGLELKDGHTFPTGDYEVIEVAGEEQEGRSF